MENPFQYDAVLKDLFQRDRPSLLSQLAGEADVKTFLNPEFQSVEKRIADLLVLLSDRSILHFDFQCDNHRNMAYRVGIYGLLAAEKYGMPIRQIVIYMGRRKMKMADRRIRAASRFPTR